MRWVVAFGLFLNVSVALASTYKKQLEELEQTLTQRDYFTQIKLSQIHTLTHRLQYYSTQGNRVGELDMSIKLFDHYRSFIYDSAFHYIENAKRLAMELNLPSVLSLVKIKQGFVLLSSGLFKEAIDTLYSVPRASLTESLMYEYYSVLGRAYFDLADYSLDKHFTTKYKQKGIQYLDTALLYVVENSNEFWFIESLRRMKLPDWRGARHAFEYWMRNNDLPDQHYAIAASSLGYIYNQINYSDKAIEYLIKAAMADVRTSTKETVALKNLARLLYENGDIKRAYRYIKLALDDATFYNARHRKIEIATILPIIESERHTSLTAQKDKLLIYSIALSALSVLVIVSLAIIYKQLRKLNGIKRILELTNKDLNELNIHLTEANRIKEEYIGYFFSINSDYIEKIEKYQKSIHRKLVARQFDEVHAMLKDFSLRKERDNLYVNFDKIFIKLFPNFVSEFNKLLLESNRIVIENDEILNPELRIFALIRLGIRDSERIAKFLNYSVNTIYTYKTKIKSKTIYRDNFEEKIRTLCQ